MKYSLHFLNFYKNFTRNIEIINILQYTETYIRVSLLFSKVIFRSFRKYFPLVLLRKIVHLTQFKVLTGSFDIGN